MNWGYLLFVLLLSGFGTVYLVWPVNAIAARYGIVAVNMALLLCTTSLTRAAMLASHEDRQRSVYLGFAIGLWLWVVAGFLEISDLLSGRPAYGSFSDVLWIIGYVPMFLGLYRRFRLSGNLARGSARIILFILLLCYGCMFYFYLAPLIEDPSRDLPSKALDIVYLSFNFILLEMTITVSRDLSAMRSPLKTPFHVLAGAIAIMTCTDVLLSYYTDRDTFIYQLLDLPYFLVYFLFFHAAQELVIENATSAKTS